MLPCLGPVSEMLAVYKNVSTSKCKKRLIGTLRGLE